MNLIYYGCITWYVAAIGTPLFCGGSYNPAAAWLALPVEVYESGEVRCGDIFAVWSDGQLHYLPARDAGPFALNCVVDGSECVPIVADLPRHVFGGKRLSRRGYVVNTMPLRERMERER